MYSGDYSARACLPTVAILGNGESRCQGDGAPVLMSTGGGAPMMVAPVDLARSVQDEKLGVE